MSHNWRKMRPEALLQVRARGNERKRAASPWRSIASCRCEEEEHGLRCLSNNNEKETGSRKEESDDNKSVKVSQFCQSSNKCFKFL